MRVPDMRHVIDRIKVCAALIIVQILHKPADYIQRLLVGEAERWSDALAPRTQNLVRAEGFYRKIGLARCSSPPAAQLPGSHLRTRACRRLSESAGAQATCH